MPLASRLALLAALVTAACTHPSAPDGTSGGTSSGSSASCTTGGKCAPEGTSCSPAPIGSGWAHAMMCQGGKWTELEIAPLPQPPPH